MVTLRPAEPTNAPALLAIRRAAILELSGPTLTPKQAHAWAEHAAPDRGETAIRDNDVWIAETDTTIAGWVEIESDCIRSLYVRPTCAGAGLGSALLRHAEDRVTKVGHAVVHLVASPNAEAFYGRRGYAPAGILTDKGAIPMRKYLTAGLRNAG